MKQCQYSSDCSDCVTFLETLLKIDNVGLSYGDVTILKDVNAEIKHVNRKCHMQGQVVGFLGPSGIGKTQMFRIIAGLNKATSGQVLVGSPGVPTHAGLIGVVSQNYTLFEHRTIIGNLMIAAKKKYPGKWYKHNTLAEAECINLLKQFGLEDKKNLYPAQLSGGQRQRIAIIQQILCSQHFLLMDEPFSGLDLVALEKVTELINDVARLDSLNTIIVVTHDVTAAASVADHLWLMGRDRDATGNIIPGARIQEIYDLIALGLCWQKDITTRPDFIDFVRTVKERFRTL